LIALDTNVVIAAVNGRTPAVRVRLAEQFDRGTPIWISSVVLVELRYGIAKSGRPDANAAILDVFLAAPVEIVPFGAAEAAEAGSIRAFLERKGTPIGPYDLLIAAHARARDAVLATANRREFSRVAGLVMVDWTAD